eukprot:m.25188 g.25188  ORF g.25188 m.25188 type:complete len:1869 (-) comp7683_c0_seq1:68-5674(-)
MILLFLLIAGLFVVSDSQGEVHSISDATITGGLDQGKVYYNTKVSVSFSTVNVDEVTLNLYVVTGGVSSCKDNELACERLSCHILPFTDNGRTLVKPDDGNWKVDFKVPTCVAPGTYSVGVSVDGKDEWKSSVSNGYSPPFEISIPDFDCAQGHVDPADGREPGCVACPVGTFANDTKKCWPCPYGTTTDNRATWGEENCSLSNSAAQEKFVMMDRTYFYHSNAGGLNLEDFYSKTPEECAQLCVNDAGCKAFDVGSPIAHQVGDCFLSYDNDRTIKKGDVRTVVQLMLSMKISSISSPIRDVFFRNKPGCYSSGSNEGGQWEDEHSPEACAQLCLNDPSCKSFDAGDATIIGTGRSAKYGTKIDDCALSYENSHTNPDAIVCDDDEFNYFERIVPIQVKIPSLIWNATGENVKSLFDARPSEQKLDEGRPRFTSQKGYFRPRNHDRDVTDIRWNHSELIYRKSRGYEDQEGQFLFLQYRDDVRFALQDVIANLDLGLSGKQKPAVFVEADASEQENSLYATVNINSDFMSMQIAKDAEDKFKELLGKGNVKLSWNGKSHTVVESSAVECPSGYVSPTGYAPGCLPCPVDTYSSRSRLRCTPCPLGMISNPRSGSQQTLKACRPKDDVIEASKGAFRVGYEWIGDYEAKLGPDGKGMGSGSIKFTVTESDFLDEKNLTAGVGVVLLVEVRHGELCVRTNNVCRTPGITSYYLKGIVTQNKIMVFKNCYSFMSGKDCYERNMAGTMRDGRNWVLFIGITDRNTQLFTPFNIEANLVYESGNLLLRGGAVPPFVDADKYPGSLRMIERCHASDLAGTFSRGDQFFGTYSCYRSNKDKDIDERLVTRVETVRRMRWEVVDAIDQSDTMDITLDVNFDHASASGSLLPSQYRVQGTYEKVTGRVRLNPARDAWNSVAPPDFPARIIGGKLSDDGEFFQGSMSLNPDCACNGKPDEFGLGTSCRKWKVNKVQVRPGLPWCYVDESCPDAIETASGLHWTECDDDFKFDFFQDCHTVDLARVCSVASGLCEEGWVRSTVQNRCYKRFDKPLPFWEAEEDCSRQQGHLVSIHSAAENQLVSTFVKNDTVWIGYYGNNESEGTWTDETPRTYVDKPEDAEDITGCLAVDETGDWKHVDCDDAKPYICRKLSFGRSQSCECTNIADADHKGGSCKQWDEGAEPWCHVAPDCPRAVKVSPANGFWRATCDDGSKATEVTTTSTPDIPDPCFNSDNRTYTDEDDNCAKCTTKDECSDMEILTGYCGPFSSPKCVKCPDGTYKSKEAHDGRGFCLECDIRCETCVGGLVDECTSCDDRSNITGTSPLHLNVTKQVNGVDVGSCISNCHEDGLQWKNPDTRRCEICSASCPNGFFRDYECTEFSDIHCELVDRCNAAQFEEAGPTPTTDRICDPITHASACKCGVLKYATKTSNTVCNVCENNDDYYGDSTSTTTTSTDAGVTIATETTTTDGPDIHCDIGTYMAFEKIGSALVCEPCEEGTYSDKPNANKCTHVTKCLRGHEEEMAPTATQNRKCRVCTEGKFQSEDVAKGPCMNHTTCDAGEYEMSAPSTSADRVCVECEANTYNTDGQVCKTQPLCQAGQGVTYDSSSEIRTCEPCPRDTFQPYLAGPCAACVLNISFRASPEATKCTWVVGLTSIEVMFEYIDTRDGQNISVGDRKRFTELVEDKLTSTLGQGFVGVAHIEHFGAFLFRITISPDAYSNLIAAAWTVAGGLDLEYRNRILKFNKTSLEIVSRQLKSEKENCFITTPATLTSDRVCGDGSVTTEETTTETQESTIKSSTVSMSQSQFEAKKADSGGSSSTVIAIVVVLIVLILAALAAFVIHKKRQSNNMDEILGRTTSLGYDNPLYDNGRTPLESEA